MIRKHFLKIAVCVLSLSGIFCTSLAGAQVQKRTWVDSVATFGMERCLPAEKFYWGWNHAILLNAMVQMYRSQEPGEREVYMNYIKTCMDRTMNRVSGNHPNFVVPGLGMAFLYGELGENAYWDKAMKVWYEYLLIPRARNYGASHRANTVELWDDTVYMLGAFFLEMYRQTGDDIYIRELLDQYYAHAEVLADKETGLWFHGWDADEVDFDDKCGQVGWADKTTRRSNEFWGRGNGWIFMTLADVLEALPKDNPMWKEAARELAKMSKKLPRWQDPETGMWYQLPVRYVEEGNFLESSCTAMFGYALSIGMRHGVLKMSVYQPVVDRAYNGLKRHALKITADGYLSPDKVCIGTCIGDKDYYFSRQVASGVDFAVGVFVMFGLEYEKQHNLR